MTKPSDLTKNFQQEFLRLSSELGELACKVVALEEKYELEKAQSTQIDAITKTLEPIAQESYNVAASLEELAAQIRITSSNWRRHASDRYEVLRDMHKHL
jgi:hypothetical protein